MKVDPLTEIQIETTTACPARCLQCPLRLMKRQRGMMDDKLVYKIIDEVLGFPVPYLLPFLNGEPFADPRMMTFIGYIASEVKRRKATTKLKFYSNIELLTRKQIDKLIKKYGWLVESFVISFEGATPATYEKVMGLKTFEKNYWKALYFLEKNRAAGEPIRLGVNILDFEETKKDIGTFQRIFKGYPAGVTRYLNWGGKEAALGYEAKDMGKPFKVPCQRVLHHLVVYWDGRVGLCCMDNEGEVILGDLNNQTVNEVWISNQPMRVEMAKLNFDKIPAICLKCNMWRYD